MEEESLVQAETNVNKIPENFVTVEQFAGMIGVTQQGVSYHIKQGKLKPYVDRADLVKVLDRQYWINPDLKRLFKAKKNAQNLFQEQQVLLQTPTKNDTNLNNFEPVLKETLLRLEQTYEELVQTKNELIKAEKEKNEILTREMEARNSAIIRLKDYEKENTELREALKTLSKDIADLKVKKPFWKFWN